MKYIEMLLFTLVFYLAIVNLQGKETSVMRGGIEYTFANCQIITLNSDMYFSFNILAASPGTGSRPRIGTGMIVIDYNTSVFGEFVNANHNATVTRGTLLTTAPFSLYNLITNDNQAGRLAVTFEYTSAAGGGNLLQITPAQLVNIRLKVNGGGFTGLGFTQYLMNGEQYQDDNATELSPVTASDTVNSVIPYAPAGLSVNAVNNVLVLTWQIVPGCTYNVYSADSPVSSSWQPVATGITQNTWGLPLPATSRFFYVTSQNNTARR